MIQFKTQVKLPELDGLSKAVQAAVQRAVKKTAFKVESDAKLNAPVDTGALRASILTEGGAVGVMDGLKAKGAEIADIAQGVKGPSGRALGKKRTKTPKGRKIRAMRAPVRAPVPTDRYSAIVAPHMHYAIYQEKKRRYMQGALLANRGLLRVQVNKAIEDAKKGR